MRDSHVARRDHGGPRVAATSHGLCCQARWPSQMSIMAQGAGVAGGWQSEHAGGAYFRRHHGLSASPCLGFLTRQILTFWTFWVTAPRVPLSTEADTGCPTVAPPTSSL